MPITMADYWKSNPKHFCEVCKCWFADNKISIENHEKGLRHKANVEKRLRETRKRAAVKEKEDEKISETLAKIEKAATAAYNRDRKGLPARESSVLKAALAKEKGKSIKTGKIPSKAKPKVTPAPPPPPSPWQQLLSPEGRIYYYHILKGVSQWECPPELKAPPTNRTAPTPIGTSIFGTYEKRSDGSIVPTGSTYDNADDDSIESQWQKEMNEKNEFLQKPFTELAALADYYAEDNEGTHPPPKKFDPYGSWTTVSVRDIKVVHEEQEEQEIIEQTQDTSENSDSDTEFNFKEKSHPTTESDSNEIKEEETVTGNFKGFTFKKRSTLPNNRTNIKQRTSDW